MASVAELPETMKALVLRSTEEPPSVEIVPTPKPTAGNAVVRILASPATHFMRFAYSSPRKFPIPKPMIPGTSAMARVVAIGPDSTKIKPGDLVFFDCVIRSRDDPVDTYLSAAPFTLTESAKRLMIHYNHGTFAEYCLSPLENLTIVNESRLTGSPANGGLGYKIEQLAWVTQLLVPYGGLRDIGLQAGQTVIIAPATGIFSGCAVLCAQAMGARVIAMSRNENALASLKAQVPYPERLETVRVTEDVEADLAIIKKFGEADAFLDIGPPGAHASTHIKSAILALRPGGRISAMAGYEQDIKIPYKVVMSRNLRIQGRYMYERSNIAEMFKMIESGLIDLNMSQINGTYGLEQWKEAWDKAAETSGFTNVTLVKP